MTNLENFVQKVEATEGQDDTDDFLKAETLLREMGKAENQKEVWEGIGKNAKAEFAQLSPETQQNLLDACTGAFNLVKQTNDNREGFSAKVEAWKVDAERTSSERALLWVLCLYDLIHADAWDKLAGRIENVPTTIQTIEQKQQAKGEAETPKEAVKEVVQEEDTPAKENKDNQERWQETEERNKRRRTNAY